LAPSRWPLVASSGRVAKAGPWVVAVPFDEDPMSLPRRAGRIIHVDGVRYRLIVTGHREPNRGIAVEDADVPSRLLIATADQDAAIVPSMVAAGVRRARQVGWDPHVAGPPHVSVEFRGRFSFGGEDRPSSCLTCVVGGSHDQAK
jgi:hypothetical protein